MRIKRVMSPAVAVRLERGEVTCEWDTGNKQIVHHVQRKDANLLDSVAYDPTKGDRKTRTARSPGST